NGDGGGGGDDRGEQSNQPVGHGGYGGQYATVGDREGCERESGDRRGGDVHPGGGERHGHGREPGDQRQRHRLGRELDAQRHGGLEHPDGHVGVAHGESGDLHGDRHGRIGHADRREQSHNSDGHGGHGREL